MSVIVFVVQAVAVVRIMSKFDFSTFVLIQLTCIDDEMSLSIQLDPFLMHFWMVFLSSYGNL